MHYTRARDEVEKVSEVTEVTEVDEVPASKVVVLPKLAELPSPLGPPIVETENPGPNEAQNLRSSAAGEAELPDEPEKLRSMQLANAFNQAEAYKRQLQEQNIYKLDGGTYAQAVPDGKGGGIMRPVDLSQVKSNQEGVDSMIGTMTANALQVQMDTLARATY